MPKALDPQPDPAPTHTPFPADISDEDRILSAIQLEKLGYGHRVTLARRRARGDGPPFIKLSPHRIGYRLGDVRRWAAQQAA